MRVSPAAAGLLGAAGMCGAAGSGRAELECCVVEEDWQSGQSYTAQWHSLGLVPQQRNRSGTERQKSLMREHLNRHGLINGSFSRRLSGLWPCWRLRTRPHAVRPGGSCSTSCRGPSARMTKAREKEPWSPATPSCSEKHSTLIRKCAVSLRVRWRLRALGGKQRPKWQSCRGWRADRILGNFILFYSIVFLFCFFDGGYISHSISWVACECCRIFLKRFGFSKTDVLYLTFIVSKSIFTVHSMAMGRIASLPLPQRPQQAWTRTISAWLLAHLLVTVWFLALPLPLLLYSHNVFFGVMAIRDKMRTPTDEGQHVKVKGVGRPGTTRKSLKKTTLKWNYW